MAKEILIIKIGALGDVLRTTPLLRVLAGNITWLTKKEAFPLLRTDRINFLADINNKKAIKKLLDKKFSLILGLDEDKKAAELASKLKTKKLTGIFLKDRKIIYTKDSSSWFDMSLISRFGLKKSNKLKKQNKLSYQEHLFRMIGKKFDKEEYVLSVPIRKISSDVVGIEARAGEKWPLKQWKGFPALISLLKREGYRILILKQRDKLEDYIDDINKCKYIICGDTLAMHIALALKKNIVAIFTCTSPQEIYDYGRLVKVTSPLLNKYYYKKEANDVNFRISVKGVLNAFEKLR